ncbi:pyridoxine/pyridoxamine 5'-phosphate oxidase [Streptomyces hainanensis]|uniref:Pyridoxal 5'-phosphate synthase n=1 Tax=Streptomyces hainanensis TaxID=402648 RepID=A0A4R4STX5_9ACTN|nr:pyridoxal 5'-phosphate synthase [Streptomyces hainanensis]TDC67521.1 pyridoxal 5'-phosphate synthase [Streptomyces hainanensis]
MSELRQLLRDLEVFAGDLPTFDPAAAPADPAALFTAWLLAAVDAGIPEPHAMTLATVDEDGAPQARVLILKNLLPATGGWQFAAHLASPKGRQLTAVPRAALTFYWQPHARQVRIAGPVVAETPERSAADFLARGRTARAEALLGRQSGPLTDPAERAAALAASRDRLAREPDAVPPEWTLYTLLADRVEFWQGDRDRRHTRLDYRRTDGRWTSQLLWP